MSENSSKNGQMILATGGYDHTIKLWQAHSGMCSRTLQHADSQVNALEITPDKQLLAAAGHQHIRMYDLSSSNPNPVINYDGVSKNVTGVGFQEEGKWMYTGGEDCSARIWDLRSRNLQCQRIFQVSAPVNCVCLHPNQAELVVGDQSGVIHLWDLKTDHNEQLIPEAEASIQSVAIDPEGSYMAAVNNKGHCYIWSLSGGMEQQTKLNPKQKIEAHSRYALKCKFSPDSTLLVTTSADQTARVWKTADFSLVQELKTEAQRWVWDLAFSADSQYILTASSDNCARLWSVEKGTVQREYTGHQKAVMALAFCDQLGSPESPSGA
ncbi:target of rapamycin complex subunit lst8 [Macrosteles quadrilineatus]|uniref:target of rapamycin complex subunit lst8 n=1 Tax=Macrosteles quadrilineatus TaxID=74068 RepID=UPI0023E2B251|nr:target of rapamycin complex subunit lst8 [Macrosteles quadrilineatus]XP_054270864.1 target of rapamycin complex subunit lst8 [Macrosteles quadrilineatus]XP_054270871.1 target of rapamycin complex subunit lst8 [Macrosteles quadrilineatus]